MKRVALVTGAAQGIGRACALRLAEAGMQVVSLDRRPVEQPPGPVIEADLSHLDRLPEYLSEAQAAAGPVDVLVNSAAIFRPLPVATLTGPELLEILTVNLHATVMLSVIAGREMVKREWGRIVTISSVHDRMSEEGALPYDIAKGGLAAATRSLAVELSGSGVLVNAVAPGFVRTPMSVVDGVDELDSDWFRELFVASGRLPIGRPATTAEIAACVHWLAGEENTYVTGSVLTADGGLTVAL